MFTFILDDPSGNSHIQNPHAPSSDPYVKRTEYFRTKEQLEAMGFQTEEGDKGCEEIKEEEEGEAKEVKKNKGYQYAEKEIDDLFNKVQKYIKPQDPQITAANLDFNKPLDEEERK